MIYLSRYQAIFGLFFLLILVPATSIQAQDGTDVYLRIYGTVVNSDNNENLQNCVVKVFKNEEFLEEYTTKGAGKYEFFLPTGYGYRFYYIKDEFVSKNIVIDCVDAAAMDDQFIFSLKADISLFKAISGMDYSVMENPIGKGVCNGKKGKVQFDKNYTKNMELQIASIYVPVEANTGSVNRVTIEEKITDVPDEDDELTVKKIFEEAENEQLAYEEVEEPAKIEDVVETVSEDLVAEPVMEIDEKPVMIEDAIEEKMETKTKAKAEEIKNETAIVPKAIPPALVESEPSRNEANKYVWRVQIGAYSNVQLTNYSGLSNVDMIKGKDGITRVVAGYFDTPLEAAKHKIKLMNKGFSDAFITAFQGDTQIPISDTGVNLKIISYTKIKEQIDK